MSVITVLGEKSDDSFGIIAPHEHLLVDAWSNMAEDRMPEIKEVTRKNLFQQKVSMSNLGELKLNALSVLDNMVLKLFRKFYKVC